MDYPAVDYDYFDDGSSVAMLAGGDEEDPPWGEGPPRFLVPPPPAPPSSPACRSGGAAAELFCQLEPVGAEFTQTAFPSLPIIAVCSSVVLVAILVASFLLWKHKRKVQNFLPCKTQPAGGRCDGGNGGITYDDVLINHHPTRLPLNADALTPIELLDVKYGNYVQQHQQHVDPLTRTNFTIPTSNNHPQQQQLLQQQQQRNGHNKQQQQRHRKAFRHPIYEEVSSDKGSDLDEDSRTVGSEDEFAEDEGSPAGSSGDLYPPATHSLERNKDPGGNPAKQNYYLNKSMLGPDFTYPEGGDRPSPPSNDDLRGSSLNFIPTLLQRGGSSPPPPPYGGGISALYNPQVDIPDTLLTFKMVAPMSSRSLPVPPACRGAGGGVLFTVEGPPFPSQQHPLSRAGSAAEFAPRGYFRPPTPPAPENIYASIDDVGPFTIDGRRRKASAPDARNNSTFGGGGGGRRGKKPRGDEAYGDIRPIYDARTACS